MSNILITGGTGSLGSALARKWYAAGHRITIFSRDPQKQQNLASELPEAIFILADICNQAEVRRACTGQDILIHAAAVKQADSGQYHPKEFGRVNFVGSIVVTEAWREVQARGDYEGGGTAASLPRKAVLISTDKAVHSTLTYGASKKLAEGVFREANLSVLRYGNVITSAGSFLHAWKRALGAGKHITTRTPHPTRFLLTMETAIALIEDALDLIPRIGNSIFIPHNLKAFSIQDVAWATGAEIDSVSLLPYEKQHEMLLAQTEGAERVSDLLSRVYPAWNEDYLKFTSDRAERLAGRGVLEAVGWKNF